MPKTADRETRADDERILRMLELRDRGLTFRECGIALGMTRSAVQGQCFRVAAALAASEGEAMSDQEPRGE